MDKKLSVGQKIKQFRNRAGISQLELEMRIETSPGSISRIESGEVNPTKETLLKIIESLSLKPYECVSLFDLHTKELPHIVKHIAKLSSSLNFDEVLQNSVDAIAEELNLVTVVMFMLYESDQTLYSNALSNNTLTSLVKNVVLKILNKKFGDVHVSLLKHQDNFLVRTVNEKRNFYTTNLWDCTIHAYPKILSDAVARIVGFKCGISFPLLYENKSLGAIFYVSDYMTDFKAEIPVFEAFNEHVVMAVANSRKYEYLLSEVQKLKQEKTNE